MIIQTIRLFSYTLQGLKEEKDYVQNTEQNVNKKLYKPQINQTRASLCHVIKREHTNIKHLLWHHDSVQIFQAC